MGHKTCEESAKNASDLKYEKVLEGVDGSIACPTPQKTSEPLPAISKERLTHLPEKYKTIVDLFSHMASSLRLLHLRKRSPTFQNVCAQVEILAKRKFLDTHLAQMKHILPEGILIDKVHVRDKKTLCMKLDMKITLVFDVVEEKFVDSADMALRRYFSSKLIDFFNMHPEATDIPEAVLPEPFSKRTCSLICADLPVDSSTVLSSTSNEIELLPGKPHLHPSFRKHFCQEHATTPTEKLPCCPSSETHLPSEVSDCLDNQEKESSWQKGCVPVPHHVTNLNNEEGQPQESFSTCFQPSVVNTPVHKICPPHGSKSETPDIKIVSCTDSLMTETPEQSAPGRSMMPTSDVKLQSMTSQKSTSCYKPAKRVLDFSLMEGNDGLDISADNLESSRAPDEIDSIQESSRGCSKEFDSSGFVALPQVQEGINPIQAGLDTCHERSSSLLNLVNVIHSIFYSLKRSPITREELMHKIIMNSLDYVEIEEVEEQVEILEKLLPDWICKTLVSSGDIMYSIKEVPDLDRVRLRLSEM